MPVAIESTPEFVRSVYARMSKTLAVIRRRLGRPLTLAEKIVYGHVDDPEHQELVAGKSYLQLRPDRVAMQDATAQMAILQFAQSGISRVSVPTTVHCDHLILAKAGAERDVETALGENREVYDFLRTASEKYGIGFWKPNSGIIHQVVLENYAFPGGLLIGTDSHTPNAGGLGMVAAGVGGADAVDVMAGLPWEVLNPELIGVVLKGKMSGWTAPKDVILALCGILTVSGGTNRIVEYLGPGARAISCTGKGTITNMGAELGATASVFPFDEAMDRYLRGTDRAALADLARGAKDLLEADREVEADPARFFHRVVEIDLSKLEPMVVGPHTPDLARPISALAREAAEKKYPPSFRVALIGSCTNSSYEDISRVADVARQMAAHGVKAAVPLMVTPGSERVRLTIERDGLMKPLADAGATVLANACGPCIGQWKRGDVQAGEVNAIVTSFNRNFPARNDGNPSTMAFIASPEVVMAYAATGRLDRNPLTEPIKAANGRPFVLEAPPLAPDVPKSGFEPDVTGYLPPAADGSEVAVLVDPKSTRLQLLEPFAPWDGKDFVDCLLLLKAKGKCTTDHISPAGPWLRFRGHLNNISDNMFLGAVNAFTGEIGKGLSQVTGQRDRTFSGIARSYKEGSRRWVAVGDDNYGEGSSREHAAMSPRFLGAAAIIARSFARIHETNLKKQGLLALTFFDPADYDRIRETDTLSIVGLKDLAPGKPVTVVINHADKTTEPIVTKHTMNDEQISWFKAGSALNKLARAAPRTA
jgi:aconitate hydratase